MDLNDPGQLTNFSIIFSENTYHIKISHGVIYANDAQDDIKTFSMFLFRQCVNYGNNEKMAYLCKSLSTNEHKDEVLPKDYLKFKLVEKVKDPVVQFIGEIKTKNSQSIPVLQLSNTLRTDDDVENFVPLSIYVFKRFIIQKHPEEIFQKWVSILLLIAWDMFTKNVPTVENQVLSSINATTASTEVLFGKI